MKISQVAGKGTSLIRHAIWVAVVLVVARTWAVVSPPQVAYDRYFDAATFAVEAVSSGDTVAYTLLLTYDEGSIRVPQGSTLTIHLRDRSTIVLASDREVARRDITMRRWRNHTIRYVTCHYPITASQLARIQDKDAYRLVIETARGPITRQLRGFNRRLVNALQAISHAPL